MEFAMPASRFFIAGLRILGGYRVVVLGLALFCLPVVHAEPVVLNIPAQRTVDALLVFSEQTGWGVLFSADELGEVGSPVVVGAFEPEEGMRRLLAETGFEAEVTGTRRFVVRRERSVRRVMPSYYGFDEDLVVPNGRLGLGILSPVIFFKTQ